MVNVRIKATSLSNFVCLNSLSPISVIEQTV